MIAYYERICQEDVDAGVGLTQKRNPGGGTLIGTQFGIHKLGIGQAKTDQAWDPATIASGGSASTTVSVPGAELGDFVLAATSFDPQGMAMSAYVSSAGTVTVVLNNLTGAGIDLGSGTVSILVLKSR